MGSEECMQSLLDIADQCYPPLLFKEKALGVINEYRIYKAQQHNYIDYQRKGLKMDYGKRLKRHCDGLNRLLEDAKKEYPDATLYLSAGYTLHLMSSTSHNDRGAPQRDNVLESETLEADGGDW